MPQILKFKPGERPPVEWAKANGWPMGQNGQPMKATRDGSPRSPKGKLTLAERRAALQKAAANLSFDAARTILKMSPALAKVLDGRKATRKYLREARALANPEEVAKIRDRLLNRLATLEARSAVAVAYLGSPAAQAAENVDAAFVALGDAADTFDGTPEEAEELVRETVDANIIAALSNPADPFAAFRMAKSPDGAGTVSVALPDNPETDSDASGLDTDGEETDDDDDDADAE